MSGWGGATNFVIIGDDDDGDTPQLVEPNQELNEDTKTKFETKMFSEPGKFHLVTERWNSVLHVFFRCRKTSLAYSNKGWRSSY